MDGRSIVVAILSLVLPVAGCSHPNYESSELGGEPKASEALAPAAVMPAEKDGEDNQLCAEDAIAIVRNLHYTTTKESEILITAKDVPEGFLVVAEGVLKLSEEEGSYATAAGDWTGYVVSFDGEIIDVWRGN